MVFGFTTTNAISSRKLNANSSSTRCIAQAPSCWLSSKAGGKLKNAFKTLIRFANFFLAQAISIDKIRFNNVRVALLRSFIKHKKNCNRRRRKDWKAFTPFQGDTWLSAQAW